MSTIDQLTKVADRNSTKLSVQSSLTSPSITWPKSGVRILFGVVWMIDAIFKWQPAFRAEYLNLIQGAAKGQPAWLVPWFHGIANVVASNPVLFAYLTAIVETLIAAGLILGVARKLTYILAALFAAAIWASAEGFGGPYTVGATDIGTGIIYSILFLALLALNYHAGPSRFSLDYLIEKHFPAWRKIAELGAATKRPRVIK